MKYHITNIFAEIVESFTTSSERDSEFDRMREEGHQIGWLND